MKKITSILACLLIPVCVSAQLKVTNSGQVQIGTNSTHSSSIPAISGPSIPDSLISLRIIGKLKHNSGGLISFGDGTVSIREISSSYLGGLYKGAMELVAEGGIFYKSNNKNIFSYDPNIMAIGAISSPFVFGTTVSAPQYLTSSDARLKTNIESIDRISLKLSDITPVSYKFREASTENIETDTSSPYLLKNDSKSQKNHSQFGFIAQDVMEVYPDLVYEDSEGMLSIDYISFIAILVDAVQNLEKKVENQAATIDELKNQSQQHSFQNCNQLPEAVLKQNKPNPFRTATTINCVVPETVANAMICVYDLNGQQKLCRHLSQRGSMDVIIDGNSMPSGMYIYALICDGIEIDSKRMILTD